MNRQNVEMSALHYDQLPGMHLLHHLHDFEETELRGLLYIVEKLERGGEIITVDDIDMFLRDLNLPHMSRTEIEVKLCAAGASKDGIVNMTQFFVFVKNELTNYREDEIIEAFLIFDPEDCGFLESDELRYTLYLQNILFF